MSQYVTCPHCKGSGEGATLYVHEPSSTSPHCGLCGGTGEVKASEAACPRCGSEDMRGCFDPGCPCIAERKS